MGHRMPKGLRGLARQRAPRRVGDGAGNYHREPHLLLVEEFENGVDCRLAVQGVEDGLDQQNINAAIDQAAGRLRVGLDQLIETDIAEAWILDIR